MARSEASAGLRRQADANLGSEPHHLTMMSEPTPNELRKRSVAQVVRAHA